MANFGERIKKLQKQRGLAPRQMAAILFIAILLSFTFDTTLAASDDISDKPVWRVLWLICRNTNQTLTDDIRAEGNLSEENIHVARQIIPYFENFIEDSVNGAVDVQITQIISDSPADWFYTAYDHDLRVGKNGYDLHPNSRTFLSGQHGNLLFDSEKSPLYDSVVAFAYLDEYQCEGYAGITSEWVSFVPLNEEAWMWNDVLNLKNPDEYTEWILLSRVALVVHEQMHYLEWKLGEKRNMPNLHSSVFEALSAWETSENLGYSYTTPAILADKMRSDADFRFFGGLQGEISDIRKNEHIIAEPSGYPSTISDVIWYRDYLSGTIRSEYSKAARGEPYYEDDTINFRYGVDPKWWSNTMQEVYLYIGFGEMDTSEYGRIPIDENGTTPILINNRTLLPIRSIIEMLGGMYSGIVMNAKLYVV